jgi:bacillolysin
MLNTITVPSNVTTMLHFNHSYGFSWGETGTTKYYFDGGILEYTIDDGSTWKDAKGLFSAGKNYNGTLYNGSYFGYNPLGGRAAFAGESRGYVSSRYNLTSLAGKSVRFRWRMGTDEAYDFFGWVVDDVRIYKCIGNPGAPALLTPSPTVTSSPTISPGWTGKMPPMLSAMSWSWRAIRPLPMSSSPATA